MKATRLLSILTGALTLLLALFSFVLSFNSLADLAAHHNISIPILFPLTVEAAVVVFSLNALYRSLHGEAARAQWVLIIGASLLAGLFNILHAPEDPLSRAMAAMPSLFLLLSFETFLGQVRHTVARTSAVESLQELGARTASLQHEEAQLFSAISAAKTQLEAAKAQAEAQRLEAKTQLEAQLSELQAAIEAAKNDLENARKEAQLGVIEPDSKIVEAHKIDGFLLAGGSKVAAATRFNMSEATVRNRLKLLNGSRMSEGE